MVKVVGINIFTKADIPPDKGLKAAIGKLDKVVISGYTKDGKEYFASSTADGPDVLWLLERCKRNLLNIEGD